MENTTRTMSNSNELTIGKLVLAANVSVETIRYYQRLGLIHEPLKPRHGFRYYPANDVDRIRFIRRAKQIGFTLSEIDELLTLGQGRCNDVRERAEARREKIKTQIDDLQNLLGTLDQLIQSCHTRDGETAHCPIVETLARPANKSDK